MYEKRYLRKDGLVVWVCVTIAPVIAPVRDAQGIVQATAAIIEDITERKKAEEALRQFNATLEQRVAERTAALRESEGRLRAFLENSETVPG